MLPSLKFLLAASMGVVVYGQLAQYCPSDGVCYRMGVPESTARSGSGNLYFQISAPTSLQWVALGTGTSMTDANIFLMYQNGAGNVTVSPRLGTQYRMPTLDTSSTAARLTLMAGSGISDGQMTANVMCANCESWNGGQHTLSVTDTRSSWIAAWRAGDSLGTTDQAASISIHDDTRVFGIDLSQAQVEDNIDPFTSDNTRNGVSSGVTGEGSGSRNTRIAAAHGIIMAIVMVILYPLGSIAMPLLGKWMAHAAFQMVAFVLMWVAFGLGVRAALNTDSLFQGTHTIFGMVIVCLFVLQPVLGQLHHQHFVKTRSRGVFSYAHIFYGRSLMILGVVNGGLGLRLSHASNTLVIAYSVVAGVVGIFYIVARSFIHLRKTGKQSHGQILDNGTTRPHETRHI